MISLNRGNHLLSGFGTDHYLKDFHTDRIDDSSSSRTPVINISENEHIFKVEIGVPGFRKGEIDISLEGNDLVVSGSKERSDKKDEPVPYKSHSREFDYSHFTRTFEIPKSVDAMQIAAKLEDGLLSIDLPKKEVTKPETRKVEIN